MSTTMDLSKLTNKTFFSWYIIVNIGILITGILIFRDIKIPACITVFSIAFSLWSLVSAKDSAIKVHDINLITEEDYSSNIKLRKLYDIVKELSEKINLPNVPEVGIYQSPDMNAFATGCTKSDSLIAFSTTLLENLNDNEIRAVAGHEIAHIANQDILGTVLIQGSIDSLSRLVVLPFTICRLLFSMDKEPSSLEILIMKICEFILSTVVMFLGKLVSLAFSRHREYRADETSSILTSPDDMYSALAKISNSAQIPAAQASFASFKISNAPSWAELFSTHPDINKRLSAIQNLALRQESTSQESISSDQQ